MSGFVLARQILFCLEKNNKSIFYIFYMRRAIRTIPPYLIYLFIMSFLTKNLFTEDMFLYTFFVRNLINIIDFNDYFSVSWSMAVEEWFYVIFPIFLLAFHTALRSPLRSVMLFIGFLIVAKVFLMIFHENYFAHIRRIALFRLDAIGFGFLLYLVTSRRLRTPSVMARWTVPLAALILGGYLFFVLDRIYDGSVAAWNMAFVLLAPLFGALVLLSALFWRQAVDRLSLLRRPSQFLGRLSYVVYLAHSPLIIVMKSTLALDIAVALPLYIAVLLVFSWGFCEFVEKPLLAMRPDYPSS